MVELPQSIPAFLNNSPTAAPDVPILKEANTEYAKLQ
jgi:hypothetical protein